MCIRQCQRGAGLPVVAWQVSSANALTLLSSRAPSALIVAEVKFQDIYMLLCIAGAMPFNSSMQTILFTFSMASMTRANDQQAIILKESIEPGFALWCAYS